MYSLQTSVLEHLMLDWVPKFLLSRVFLQWMGSEGYYNNRRTRQFYWGRQGATAKAHYHRCWWQQGSAWVKIICGSFYILTSWVTWPSPSSTSAPSSSSSTPAPSNRGYIPGSATGIKSVGGWPCSLATWWSSLWRRRRFVQNGIIVRVFHSTFWSFKIQRNPLLTASYKQNENC